MLPDVNHRSISERRDTPRRSHHTSKRVVLGRPKRHNPPSQRWIVSFVRSALGLLWTLVHLWSRKLPASASRRNAHDRLGSPSSRTSGLAPTVILDAWALRGSCCPGSLFASKTPGIDVFAMAILPLLAMNIPSAGIPFGAGAEEDCSRLKWSISV